MNSCAFWAPRQSTSSKGWKEMNQMNLDERVSPATLKEAITEAKLTVFQHNTSLIEMLQFRILELQRSYSSCLAPEQTSIAMSRRQSPIFPSLLPDLDSIQGSQSEMSAHKWEHLEIQKQIFRFRVPVCNFLSSFWVAVVEIVVTEFATEFLI